MTQQQQQQQTRVQSEVEAARGVIKREDEEAKQQLYHE